MTVTATVEFWFGYELSDPVFILDDATRGQLDSSTYLLAGDVARDVTGDVTQVSIRRGRSRQLDSIDAGSCTVSLLNIDGDYEPGNDLSPYYLDILPGKRVRVTASGVIVFDGLVEDWNLSYQPGAVNRAMSTATAVCADALAALGRRELAAHTAASQASGARVSAVLARSEINYLGGTSIDAGSSTLQGDAVDAGTNALDYLQIVAQTEQGRLFVTRDGVLRFAGRTASLNQSATVSLTDQGQAGDIPFAAVDLDYGSEQLYNRVTVERAGGTAQTADDSTSQGAYGVRALSVTGLLFDSDSAAGDCADYLLSLYKDPALRITGITVETVGLSGSAAASVHGIDLGDVVAVYFHPRGGVSLPIEQTAIVEGISHEISLDSHRVTLSLVPADLLHFFTLDGVSVDGQTLFGTLDTDRLAF